MNTIALKTGSKAFFDVLGETDIHDTYIVTINKRIRKGVYIVISDDTGEVFQCAEKHLTPYDECKDMKEMLVLRNMNTNLFDIIDVDIIKKMKESILMILNNPETFNDKKLIDTIKETFSRSMDSLLCRIQLSIRNSNENDTVRKIYNKEFKNFMKARDSIVDKFRKGPSNDDSEETTLNTNLGPFANNYVLSIGAAVNIINYHFYQIMELSKEELENMKIEDIYTQLKDNCINYTNKDDIRMGDILVNCCLRGDYSSSAKTISEEDMNKLCSGLSKMYTDTKFEYMVLFLCSPDNDDPNTKDLEISVIPESVFKDANSLKELLSSRLKKNDTYSILGSIVPIPISYEIYNKSVLGNLDGEEEN